MRFELRQSVSWLRLTVDSLLQAASRLPAHTRQNHYRMGVYPRISAAKTSFTTHEDTVLARLRIFSEKRLFANELVGHVVTDRGGAAAEYGKREV